MDAVKAAGRRSRPDPAVTETLRDQLGGADYAVLAAGDLSDRHPERSHGG